MKRPRLFRLLPDGQAFPVRLAALLVVVNVFAVTLAALALTNTWRHQQETARTMSENLTRVLENSIGATIDRVDDALATVVDEIQEQERHGHTDPAATLALMTRQAGRTAGILGLRVTDANGQVVLLVGNGVEHAPFVADRSYFHSLSDTPDAGLMISKPVLSRVTGQWVLVLARRVEHRDGSFAGIAYAPVTLEALSRAFSGLDLGPHGAAALRDGTLAVVARFPEKLNSGDSTVGAGAMSQQALDMVARAPLGGSYFAVAAIDGVARSLSYRRIGNHPLYIFVGLAAQDYLREWWGELLRTVLLLALFLLLTMWAARRMLRSWRDEEAALLQASEASARLGAIFSSTPIGLAILDQDRRIHQANATLSEIFAVPQAELLGNSSRVLYGNDEEFVALGAKAYPLVTDGQTFSDTVAMHRRDGKRLWIRLGGRLVSPAKPDLGYVWIFEDISEQIATTEALRASEERFRVLVDGIRDYAIILLDPDGRVQTWNQGADVITGYPAKEIVGQSIERLYAPEDVAAGLPRRTLDAARRLGHFEGENWRVRKDGTRFWASVVVTALHDKAGTVRGFAKITHDVTANRRAAEEIHRLATYQQAILNNTPVGIAILALDRTIIQANGAFCRIYGREGENLAGQPAAILYGDPAQSDDVKQRAYPQVLSGGTFADDVLMSRRDGTRIWVRLVAHLVDEGKPELGVVWAAQDISALKELNENLLRSNAELERFAYVASHDLRQPLRMISSYTGLIERRLRKTGLDEEMSEFLGYVIDGAQRMDRMIIDMLEYSRIGRQSSPREDVALDKPLSRALSNLESVITETDAEVTVVPPLPTVNASASELERLFQNLIGNALKFRAPDRAPKVTVSCQETPTEWIVSVADNGIGIDPSQYDRLFALFSRLVTQQQYEGTGIGLAACRKIAEHHGGRIWLEPAPEHGTVFHVALARPIPEHHFAVAPDGDRA